jgi:hypothetical protein
MDKDMNAEDGSLGGLDPEMNEGLGFLRYLPLHKICLDPSITEENLRKALELFPEAINYRDPIGCLPLHYLCMNVSVGAPLILQLIKKNPRALVQKTSHHRCPLHYLCMNPSINASSLQVMLRFEEAHMADMAGDFPLHHLCRNRSIDVEMLEVLLDSFPDAAKLANVMRDLPLHLLCQNRMDKALVLEHLVEILTQAYPSAAKRPNVLDAYPLHHLCTLRSVTLNALKFVCGLFPQALERRGQVQQGALPQLPLECLKTSSDDLVAALLASHPLSNYINILKRSLAPLKGVLHLRAFSHGAVVEIELPHTPVSVTEEIVSLVYTRSSPTFHSRLGVRLVENEVVDHSYIDLLKPYRIAMVQCGKFWQTLGERIPKIFCNPCQYDEMEKILRKYLIQPDSRHYHRNIYVVRSLRETVLETLKGLPQSVKYKHGKDEVIGEVTVDAAQYKQDLERLITIVKPFFEDVGVHLPSLD